MSLFPRTSLALVLILAAAAIGATAGASGSSAGVTAARSCGSYHKGSVYIIGLHTTRTSCKTGRRVANAFTKCRHRHGARGHCHHKVLHFKCKESRGQSSPTQYDSSVHCSRGSKRVRFTYSQNT